MIEWELKTFAELSTGQLYQLLQLRVDVFVVEQRCAYRELDDLDSHPQLLHLLGYQQQQLVAYARLLPPDLTYPTPSIGRVVTAMQARGDGIGHQLLSQAISATNQHWPDQSITIEAQHHLQHFYQAHGFVTISEMYLEDGIPHVDMRRD